MKNIKLLISKIVNDLKSLQSKAKNFNFQDFIKSPDFEKLTIRGILTCALIFSLGVILFKWQISHVNEESRGEHHEEEGEKIIEIKEEAIKISGIKIEKSEKTKVDKTIKLRGRISPNRDLTVDISPRFSGTIIKIYKDFGDFVQKGEALALVESSQGQASFDVRSGIAGIIVDRRAARGGFVSDKETIFSVVNPDSVWVELYAPDIDASKLKVGQKIKVVNVENSAEVQSEIFYVSSKVFEDSQSVLIRGAIDNKDRAWPPGSFVEAEIFTEGIPDQITIKRNAIQILEDKAVVFVKKNQHFKVKEVETGEVGNTLIAINAGIEEGEEYVAENSFILKAELLKSAAEHEH